jgi:hypothetical protein
VREAIEGGGHACRERRVVPARPAVRGPQLGEDAVEPVVGSLFVGRPQPSVVLGRELGEPFGVSALGGVIVACAADVCTDGRQDAVPGGECHPGTDRRFVLKTATGGVSRFESQADPGTQPTLGTRPWETVDPQPEAPLQHHSAGSVAPFDWAVAVVLCSAPVASDDDQVVALIRAAVAVPVARVRLRAPLGLHLRQGAGSVRVGPAPPAGS